MGNYVFRRVALWLILFVYVITLKAEGIHFQGNGDFAMIGNVNYELEGGYQKGQETTRRLIPVDTDVDPSTSNSSSAAFCLGGEFCENDSIVYAGLTWSGKILNDAEAATGVWKSVLFRVSDTNAYATVTANESFRSGLQNNNQDNKGIYTCHADVTSFFSKAITAPVRYDVTVANIITETEASIATKFGGWTLTIIYRQKEKDERSVHYFPLQAYEPCGANSLDGENIHLSLNLGNPYSGIGDIIMGTAIVGGAAQSSGDMLYVSSNAGLEPGSNESARYLIRSSGSTALTDGTADNNYLHNSIQMRTGCSSEEDIIYDQSIGYSRGYDQHIHKFSSDTVVARTPYYRVLKGDQTMNVFLSGNSEHHLMTDVVVMTDVAQTPKIEAVQDAQKADSSVIYTINVKTKQNVEDLNNFSLTVQLPDYANKISDISFAGALLNVQNPGQYAMGVNPSQGSSYRQSVRSDTSAGWFSLNYLAQNAFQKSIQSHTNQSVSTVKTGQTLTFKYSGTIPMSMANTTVLTISFRVWLDVEKYADKARLDGSAPTATSQSRMEVTGAMSGTNSAFYSNPQSVLDSLQACDDFYDFGGGGSLDGGGGGAAGGGGGGGGGSTVNGQPSTIDLDFDYGCSNIPDTIHIDGCVGGCLDLSIIEEVLLKEYDFSVKKEAKKDSLNWIEVKRDEIIELCQLGLREQNDMKVSLRRGEKNNNIIFSDSASWYDVKRYWTENTGLSFTPDASDPLFSYFRDSCAVDSIYIVDELFPKIDEVIQRPVSYSHIEYLLDKENQSWNTGTEPCIPVKNTVYFVEYKTPYHEKLSNSLCKDTVFIVMSEEKVDYPHLYKGSRFIGPGDTIQYCLDAKIDTLQLIKKKKNYQLAFKDSLQKVSFLEYVTLSDTIYRYVPTMDTKTAAVDSFKMVQINNGGCVSDTFTYFVEVLDVKSTIKPKLPKDTIVCWVDPSEKDSIRLDVINMTIVDSMRNEGFDLAWYLIDDTPTHNDSLLMKDVISIFVPKDSVGRFGYGATFYYLGCESEMDTFIVEVKALPKKLVTSEISFCQYVQPDSAYIASTTMKANSSHRDFTDLLWYPMGSTIFSEASAEPLTGILTLDLDFDKCGEKNLIVQPMSEYGCLGDTSLLSINVVCFDSMSTKFKNGIDSILFCIGDATKEITSFIDTALYPKNSTWVWYNAAGDVPENTVGALSTTGSITPTYNTKSTFAHDYYLARVDSNNCISNPSKFRVVVGDSIQSTPFIGDTTQVNYTNNAALIEFCQGVHLYKQDVLPLKATVDGYTMEAVKKTGFTDDCDTLLKYEAKRLEWNSKKKDKIELPVNESGTTYYCIRQSTPMGCHGPWTTITILVDDSVRGVPTVDTIQLCQMDEEVQVSDYVTNPTNLNLGYYDADKNAIDVRDAVVTADVPSQNLTSLKNNLYYVSLRNSDTKCEGRLVGVESIVHPKPQVPVVGNDTLYFCVGNELVNLTDSSATTIYPSDKNTELVWLDAPTFVTDQKRRATFYVYQRDTMSGCVGDKDTVEVFVEKTFDYQHVDTTFVCYGETVDLWTKVENALTVNRTVIHEAAPLFTIKYLKGTTPQQSLSEEKAKTIGSLKSPVEESVQRYLISIDDAISGCSQKDTVVLLFRALPKLEPLNPITKCQYQLFDLPTPTTDYDFEWKREDGTTVGKTNGFSLEKSEVITLVATTLETPACQDSVKLTVNIHDIPAVPLVKDTTACQYTGDMELAYQLVGTDENRLENISLAWMREDSSFITRYKTDTFFTSKILQEEITAVVTNAFTGCYSSKSITVTLLQKMNLAIDDPAPLCQPETFDAVTFINQHISANRAVIGGNEPALSGYFTLYPSRQDMTVAEMSALEYNAKSSTVNYVYQMTDAQKVCVVEDTFALTIHPKPAVPMIEEGEDSLFFCKDKAPLTISATDTTYTKSLQLVWQDGVLDSPYQLDEKLPSAVYSVYLEDTLSMCQGDPASVVAVVANPIVVKPIGGKDTLYYCVGETVDLWTMAYQSFVVDKKFRSDVSIISAKKGSFVVNQNDLENYTSLKQDTSSFHFIVEDALTLCSQENSVTVIFHGLPDFHIEGEKEVCWGDDISLSVVGDDRPITYAWYYSDSDQLLSNDEVYRQSDLTKDTAFRVEATLMHLTRCKKDISYSVKVNPLPQTLPDTLIEFCQDTTAVLQKVNFNRSTTDIDLYSIQWYSQEGDSLQLDENMSQDIQTDGMTKYQAEVTNRKTGCVSSRATMTVMVHPQVRIHWTDPDTICQPFTYNLMEELTKSVYGGTHPRFQSATMDGNEVTELTAIAENSKLLISYMDDYGCKLKQNVSVHFYAQPKEPTLKGETIVCQSTGDVILTAAKNGTNTRNQTFAWTGGGREEQSDEFVIPTGQFGTTDYVLKSVDTLSHCYSEPTTFTMDIRKKIEFEPVGLLESCFNVPVDLPSKVEGNFYGSDEEKHFSYYSVTSTGNVLSVADPTNVLKSGKYVVEASESESGCMRKDTVDVVVYDSLAIYATGPQEICYGAEVVGLKANNADAYDWRRANGVAAEGEIFPFSDAVSETETFRLIGEKKIGTLYCFDSIDVTVKVNPLPSALRDTAIAFCQDTTASPVKINFNRSLSDIEQFSMKWLDERGDSLQVEENMLQPIQADGVTKYQAEVINRKTGCVSPRATMTVTVHPQVRIHWTDPDTICQPATYNLMEALTKSIYGGTNPQYQYTTKNGEKIDYETAIAENSKLMVYYEDDYGCKLAQAVDVQFFAQPKTPTLKGETIVCQANGDVVLTATKNGSNTRSQTFVWTGGGREEQSDEFVVSTDQFGTTDYVLRSIDTLTHCYSEPDTFTMDVRKNIQYDPVGLIESCYNVPVDLPSKVEGSYYGSDEEKQFAYYSVTSTGNVLQLTDATQVLKSGKYLVKAYESESGCSRQDTIDLLVYDSLAVYATGPQEICYGDEVTGLKANNADAYDWRRANGVTAEGELFPFADAVRETETFRLIGEKKMGTLFCFDSVDVMVKVNPLPLTMKDTTLYFCQDKAGNDVAIVLNTHTESDEPLQLVYEEPFLGTTHVKEAGSTTYRIRQENTATHCLGDYSRVTAVVHPQIEVSLPDSSTCESETIDLMTIAQHSVTAGTMSGLITTDAVLLSSEGDRVVTDQAKALKESGLYTVRYSYTANNVTCSAEGTSKLTFNPRPVRPTVEGQEFCQLTGEHTLEGSPSDNHLRLIWEDLSAAPYKVDTLQTLLSTDVASTKYYHVRQIQDVSGCVSLDTTITVTIHPAVKPQSYRHDICVGEEFYMDDVVLKYAIQDEVVSLYNETRSLQYADLLPNLAETARYQFVVRNEHGCLATDTLQMTVHAPENLTVTNLDARQKYCYGDLANVVASTTNASTFKWAYLGDTIIGDSYRQPIVKLADTLRVVAYENEMGCKLEDSIVVYAHPKIDLNVEGNTNVCAGTQVELSLSSDGLSKVEWSAADTTSQDYLFSFYPSASQSVKVRVVNTNNCTDSTSVVVNVAAIPNPIISVANSNFSYDNKKYTIDKDNPSVDLKALSLSDLDHLTLVWNYGDGQSDEERGYVETTHSYDKEVFVYNLPKTVSVEVTHDYGCTGSAVATVTIDPSIDIPNTFYVDGESIFMEDNKLQIFDRVGTLIHEGYGWDGTYKGKPASEDTYFYALHYYVGGEEKVETGYVTVVH